MFYTHLWMENTLIQTLFLTVVREYFTCSQIFGPNQNFDICGKNQKDQAKSSEICLRELSVADRERDDQPECEHDHTDPRRLVERIGRGFICQADVAGDERGQTGRVCCTRWHLCKDVDPFGVVTHEREFPRDP